MAHFERATYQLGGRSPGAGPVPWRRREVDPVVLIAIPAVLVAVVIGVVFGWKWVLAPLLGYALFRWSLGMLRSMVADGRAVAAIEHPQPRPASGDERVMYWCEECGVELVLVVHGSGKAPRHCGTAMHERAELLSN